MRLVTADRPGLVLLQEVPAWALERLDEWSGMTAVGDVAQRPRAGPVPLSAGAGRLLTELHHGLLRSAFAGQANAILASPELRIVERHVLTLNPASFRRPKARMLGLDWVARLAWAKERRVCQAVRLEQPGGRMLAVANVHATSLSDPRIPDLELGRATAFVDAVAGLGEAVVLGGDFNVRHGDSSTLAALASPERGFSPPGPGIDHVLVRGLEAGPLQTWPEARRRREGVVLSDHAPVELEVA